MSTIEKERFVSTIEGLLKNLSNVDRRAVLAELETKFSGQCNCACCQDDRLRAGVSDAKFR